MGALAHVVARRVALFALLGLAGLGGGAAACKSTGNALENAAAKDPMRCEQDPSCAKGRSSYVDCTRQCVDDPECMQRCQMIQGGVDGTPGRVP